MLRISTIVVLLFVVGPLFAQEKKGEVDKRGQVEVLFAGTRARADFIIVVDASGSMRALVAEVRRALPDLVRQLPEGDHLSVLRFAERADEYIPDRDIRDSERAALVDEVQRLAEPTGRYTDLGAGIERTLRELNRPGFGEIQFVFFLSDFCHEPPPDSPYRGERIGNGPCFAVPVDRLAEEAHRTLVGHKVRVIALALPGTNREGFEALRRVFPNTYRVDITLANLGAYFERFRREVALEKASVLAQEEVRQGQVGVEIPNREFRLKGGQFAEVVVRARHSMAHLSASLTLDRVDFRPSSPDLALELQGSTLLAKAGETVEWRGRLFLKPQTEGIEKERTLHFDGTLSVRVVAVAEPREALLQLNVEPSVKGAEATVTLTAETKVGWSTISLVLLFGGIGIVALLLLGFVACLLRRSRPAYLVGTLRVTHRVGTNERVLGNMSLSKERLKEVTLGSGQNCGLRFDGPGVAAVHCRLYAERAGLCGGRLLQAIEIFNEPIRMGGRTYQRTRLAAGPGTTFEMGEVRVEWRQ